MSLDVYIPEQTAESAYSAPAGGMFSSPLAAAPTSAWDVWYGDLSTSTGETPYALQQQFGVGQQFGQRIGLSDEDSLRWFRQGLTNNFAAPEFAGATDYSNMALRPAWGMLEMARESGNLTPELLMELQDFAQRGYEDMNLRREMDKQKGRAALGQFVGMLGGVALSPFAFGGSEFLGNLGGQLARGAANVVGTAIGGGNPLGALAGAAAGPLAELGGTTQGFFSSLGPTGARIADNIVRSFGVSALQQTANTGRIDPAALLMDVVPGAADTAFDAFGGWSGMFGGGRAAAPGWSSGYDLPTGTPAPTGLSMLGPDGGDAFFIDQPTFGSAMLPPPGAAMPTGGGMLESFVSGAPLPAMPTGGVPLPADIPNNVMQPSPDTFVPTTGAGAYQPMTTIDFGMLAGPRGIDRSFVAQAPAQEGEPIDLAVQAQPDATPGDTQDDLFMPEEQAPERAWYDSIKPSALIGIGIKLAGLLGADNAAADEGRAIAEAEYATDAERRQAYLDYANRVFGSIPEIAAAYDPKFFAENSAMGRVEIDPATGEIRYVMTPEGQAALDKMLSAADGTMSQILGTDVTQLSQEEFTKRVEALQGKRDADLAKLMRVLYARGMLGVATYESAGTNLITGQIEGFQLDEGQEANPYLAAYLTGVERENAALAGKSLNDAQDFIDNLLAQSTEAAGGAMSAQDSLLSAVLGAGSRYGARNAAEQARGGALADLLQSPAGLFGGNVSGQDLAAALALQNEEEQRRRAAMGGM